RGTAPRGEYTPHRQRPAHVRQVGRAHRIAVHARIVPGRQGNGASYVLGEHAPAGVGELDVLLTERLDRAEDERAGVLDRNHIQGHRRYEASRAAIESAAAVTRPAGTFQLLARMLK